MHPQYITKAQRFMQEQISGGSKNYSNSPRASPVSLHDPSQLPFSGRNFSQLLSNSIKGRIQLQRDQSPTNKNLLSYIAEKVNSKDQFSNKYPNPFLKQKSANEVRPNQKDQKKLWLKTNVLGTSTPKTASFYKNNFIKEDFMNEPEVLNQNEDTRDTTPGTKKGTSLVFAKSRSEEDKDTPKSISRASPTSMTNSKTGAIRQKSQHSVQNKGGRDTQYNQNARRLSAKISKEDDKKNYSLSQSYQKNVALKKAKSLHASGEWNFNGEDEEYKRTPDQDFTEKIKNLDNENMHEFDDKLLKVQDLQKQTEMDQKALKHLQDQLSQLQKLSRQGSNSSKASPYASFIKPLDETFELSSQNLVNKWPNFEEQDLNAQRSLVLSTFDMLKNENQALRQANRHLLQFKEAAKRYRDLANARDEECYLLYEEVAQLRNKLGLPPRDTLPRTPTQILSPKVNSSPVSINKFRGNDLGIVPSDMERKIAGSKTCFTAAVEACRSDNDNDNVLETPCPENLTVKPFPNNVAKIVNKDKPY